ncbi:MAG: hypothetical protein ACE19L_00935 [Candidatus Karelsulcia muelleri]
MEKDLKIQFEKDLTIQFEKDFTIKFEKDFTIKLEKIPFEKNLKNKLEAILEIILKKKFRNQYKIILENQLKQIKTKFRNSIFFKQIIE